MITAAVVKAGIPPSVLAISMAIGVVTDLGIREISTGSLAPSALPQKYATIMATALATVTPKPIGSASLGSFCDYGKAVVPKQ